MNKERRGISPSIILIFILLALTVWMSFWNNADTDYSVGRIVGESAALLFTAGFAHALGGFFDALSSSGATLTVALYVYATEDGNFEVAFAIAAILMILTLLINLSATLIGKYFERKNKA